MYIVSVINEKGGVGKTTVTTHVGAGLAAMGYRVMLIDADPQAHTTFTMGAKKSGHLYDLLVREASWKAVSEAVNPAYYGDDPEAKSRLFLVASNTETRNIAGSLQEVGAGDTVLRERLMELADDIDVVLIDTSPSPSNFHAIIYMATDAILYPTELEALSFNGLGESLRHLARIQNRRMNAGYEMAKVMGIVPMKTRPRQVVHQANYELLLEQFKTYKIFEQVQQRATWSEASKAKQLIYTYAPRSAATKEAWRLVQEVKARLSA